MIRLAIAACIAVLTCGGLSLEATASDDPDNPPLADKGEEHQPLSDSDKRPLAETDADPATIRDFERHRAGACPEGPPCQVEDY